MLQWEKHGFQHQTGMNLKFQFYYSAICLACCFTSLVYSKVLIPKRIKLGYIHSNRHTVMLLPFKVFYFYSEYPLYYSMYHHK